MPFSPSGAGGGSGTGNVTGAGPVIDESIVRFDGVTGLIIQGGYNAGVAPTLSDAGVPTVPALTAPAAPNAGLLSPVMASVTGLESAAQNFYYNPTYTGTPGGGGGGSGSRQMMIGDGVGFVNVMTRTDSVGAVGPLAYLELTVNPAANQDANSSLTALKARWIKPATATKKINFGTVFDAYGSTEDGATGDGVAGVGVSARFEINSVENFNSGIIGSTNTAMLRKAGSSAAAVIGGQSDMDDGGIATLAGNAADFVGYAVRGLNLSAGMTATDRAGIRINTQAGAAATKDFSFEGLATQPYLFSGNVLAAARVAIGGNFSPSVALEFAKEITTVQQIARSTTAATVGPSLTIQAGGATLGSTDKSAGAMTIASGIATGAGTSSFVLVAYGTTGAGSGSGDATPNILIQGTANRIGFFGATTVVKQTSAANLTNNVTAGGVNDTIADYADLTVYANDAAAIRNDIYQLARKLKQVNDGLRSYGLLT